MSVNFLHDHDRSNSLVHRLPAALKFAVAIGLMLTTILLPRTPSVGLSVVASVLIVIAIISRIPALFLLKRLLLLEPLVIGVAVLMLLQPNGLHVFLAILLKTNLCLLTTVLLSNTTPFSEMLKVLRQLHVPWLMVSTLTLMHRYLFVLAEEAERMRRARASRTFKRQRRFQWRTLSTVWGNCSFARRNGPNAFTTPCAREAGNERRPSKSRISNTVTMTARKRCAE